MAIIPGPDLGQLLGQIIPRLPSLPSGPNRFRPNPAYRGAPLIGGNRALMRPVSNKSPISPRVAERQGQQQQNPLGDLYEMLLELLTGNSAGAGVDMGAIRGSIDPVYDARIGAIQDAMSRQEERVGRGREDVEGMYDALGEDYERLAPEQREQAQEAQADVDELYGQLATSVEGTYSRIAEEQADLFQRLGIQAAAPATLNPQAEQAAAATSRANELGAINEQRYADMGNVDETYYREGAPLARLTGSNISSDLLFQLNDYLAEQQSAINTLEAERAAAVQSAFTQLQQSAASAGQQEKQFQTGMLFDLLKMQMAAQAPGEMNASSFLGSLPPAIQSNVASAFRQLERSPEAVYGAVEDPRHPVPGTFRNTTDEWWYNRVDQMYEAGEIDDATRQYLMTFLRMYLNE